MLYDISMPKNARAKIVNAQDKHRTQTVTVGRDWGAPEVDLHQQCTQLLESIQEGSPK